METGDLINIGFARNEAIVYLALARFGEANANSIIKSTKLHKKLVYENLEKLIDKGLVNYMVEGKIKVFRISPPHMLVEFFDEKLAKDKEDREKAFRISEELDRLPRITSHKQQAHIYRGKKGIRTFYEELLKNGNDYSTFGAPHISLDIMGEHFWLNFAKRKEENSIRNRIIFNESLREYGDKVRSKHISVKYFDRKFEPLTETNIQDDRVTIIVWTEEPILFLIRDRNVATDYLRYFEEMWKEAKK